MSTPSSSRVSAPSVGLLHFFCIAIVVMALDQVTKAIVVSHLHLYQDIELIPQLLAIRRIHNSGIAFGLFPGLPNIFTIVTLFSMLIVFYFYLTTRERGPLLSIGCALILGGAMGNLLDRVRLGYVVDFIDFRFWPAFNVADSGVSIGVAILLVVFLREQKGTAENASDTV